MTVRAALRKIPEKPVKRLPESRKHLRDIDHRTHRLVPEQNIRELMNVRRRKNTDSREIFGIAYVLMLDKRKSDEYLPGRERVRLSPDPHLSSSVYHVPVLEFVVIVLSVRAVVSPADERNAYILDKHLHSVFTTFRIICPLYHTSHKLSSIIYYFSFIDRSDGV